MNAQMKPLWVDTPFSAAELNYQKIKVQAALPSGRVWDGIAVLFAIQHPTTAKKWIDLQFLVLESEAGGYWARYPLSQRQVAMIKKVEASDHAFRYLGRIEPETTV